MHNTLPADGAGAGASIVVKLNNGKEGENWKRKIVIGGADFKEDLFCFDINRGAYLCLPCCL